MSFNDFNQIFQQGKLGRLKKGKRMEEYIEEI